MFELELENKNAPINSLDLDFVLKNPWDVVLEKLTQDMSPENIDIIKLADRYRKYIFSMKDYNLKIPARFIFICSVLLRMKSDILFGNKIQEFPAEFEDDFVEDFPQKEYFIPEIKLPVKRAPTRRVTLEDLKKELAKALDIKDLRKERWQNRKTDFGVHLKKSDIEEKLNNMMFLLKKLLTGHKSISFEDLLQEKNKKEIVEKFIQVLHLETKEQVECIQKEFLGEILIKLKKKMREKNNE